MKKFLMTNFICILCLFSANISIFSKEITLYLDERSWIVKEINNQIKAFFGSDGDLFAKVDFGDLDITKIIPIYNWNDEVAQRDTNLINYFKPSKELFIMIPTRKNDINGFLSLILPMTKVRGFLRLNLKLHRFMRYNADLWVVSCHLLRKRIPDTFVCCEY